MELAESKRQLDLKNKEGPRFQQEFSAAKQAASKSQEADPNQKEQIRTQASSGPGISYRIFMCETLVYIDYIKISLNLFKNISVSAVLSNITQCHFM